MLKELNRIAAALLGLHGYPTQPWTSPAEGAAGGRNTKAAGSSGRNGETRKRVSRRPRAGLPTRAWR